MEIARNWILAKVQETERASSVLLKDELFQAFHAENPDISHEAFLSYFGRFMGSAPFQSVTPHKRKGKILGYCRFFFLNNETNELVVQKKEVHQNMINVFLLMKYQLKAKKKWLNSKQKMKENLVWGLLKCWKMMRQVRKVLMSRKTKI